MSLEERLFLHKITSILYRKFFFRTRNYFSTNIFFNMFFVFHVVQHACFYKSILFSYPDVYGYFIIFCKNTQFLYKINCLIFEKIIKTPQTCELLKVMVLSERRHAEQHAKQKKKLYFKNNCESWKTSFFTISLCFPYMLSANVILWIFTHF